MNASTKQNSAIPTDELIAALNKPDAYPHPVDSVDFLQTHISLLFFAGDRVYKIKKPLDMGFLDYTTLEQRKHFCDEEVRLNSRLAPETYLGVVGLTRDDSGQIHVEGEGETIEYAVQMKRLPEHRMLNTLLEHGIIDNARLDAIVDLLVDFHARAASGPDITQYAEPTELRRQVRDNVETLKRFAAPLDENAEAGWRALSSALLQRLAHHMYGFLDDHDSLLHHRVKDNRIREGHGDLHAGNICLPSDDPHDIVIYDCIEFTPAFRCRDVACEMAFLAMDLDVRGYRGFSQYMIHQYAERAHDDDMDKLVPFYKLHLASVRGMVSALKVVEDNVDEDDREQARHNAKRYLHVAASYTIGPALIIMCGQPGTGKSWAARHIAEPFEAVVLRSDVIRKEMAGIALTSPVPEDRREEIYSRPWTNRVYERMLERADETLKHGRPVIVDATFSSVQRRARFLDLAHARDVPVAIVHTTAPDEIVLQRMKKRAEEDDVSDADWRVYEMMRDDFESLNEDEQPNAVHCEPDTQPDDLVDAVIERLITGHCTSHAM